ncbi:MAG TPA: hypothetical protein IAA61_06140 [Candidatus Ornithomonoglobus merdipullorum]|uniref:Uncharacterized protein n=1 Tax=Candidatus Ornithomonoglobus merdipullorum TaxID=2840895 RepID=A0A9D1MBZ3_9FIRM|nr:hypothetical protein [Candidatus Ornithomonoglobus merdipullorum]
MDAETKQMFELMLSRFDDLEGKIQEVRNELKAEIQDVRTELYEVRDGLKAEIQDVRTELYEVRDGLKAEIQDIRAELKKNSEETARLSKEVNRNTIVIEGHIDKAINVLADAYAFNSEKLKGMDINAVKDNADIALTSVRLLSDNYHMLCDRVGQLEKKIS